MSGLERSADALLERKAIQLSNHQRTQSRIDDTVLKIRTHMVNTKAAVEDIKHLRVAMAAHDDEFKGSDDAVAHLADRHMLQTATTNQETERAVGFGRQFKELHDCQNGLLERVCTAVEVGTAMRDVINEHAKFLEASHRVGSVVGAIAQQTRVLAMCEALAGHCVDANEAQASDEETDNALDANRPSTSSHSSSHIHPLLLWSRGQSSHNKNNGNNAATAARGTEAVGIVASSTAQWDRHIATVTADTQSINDAIAATEASRTAVLEAIAAKKAELEQLESDRVTVESESNALKSEIEGVKAAIEAKRAERAAVEAHSDTTLSAAIATLKASIAAKEASNAAAQQGIADRCRALEERIVTVCDQKHDVSDAVDALAKEQSSLTAAIAEQREKNASKRRAIAAKVIIARRLENLQRTAARRVLDLRADVESDQSGLDAAKAQRDALTAFLAAREDEAIRFEWGVEHQRKCGLLLEQLTTDEASLRVGAEHEFQRSFDYFALLAAVSVDEMEGRRAIIDAEEAVEWSALTTTMADMIEAEHKRAAEAIAAAAVIAANAAAAAAAVEKERSEREALARKRPRESSVPSALMAGHRALLLGGGGHADPTSLSVSQSILMTPSRVRNGNQNLSAMMDASSQQQQQQQQAPMAPSSSMLITGTPLRQRATAGGNGGSIAATPSGKSTTLANAQALLANTSSLLMEASKPIQPMMMVNGSVAANNGGFTTLGGGAAAGAVTRNGGASSAAVAMTPRRMAGGGATVRPITAGGMPPSGAKLIPLPPGAAIPANVRATSNARAQSEESVISLFRSVSMPQQPIQATPMGGRAGAPMMPLTMANLGKNTFTVVNANSNSHAAAGGGGAQQQGLPQRSLLGGTNLSLLVNSKIPSTVAGWNPIPPSPTPTDLGGGFAQQQQQLQFTAIGTAQQQQNNNNHGSYNTAEESEDEISLSRLMMNATHATTTAVTAAPHPQQQQQRASGGSGGAAGKRVAAMGSGGTPTRNSGGQRSSGGGAAGPVAVIGGTSPSPKRPAGKKAAASTMMTVGGGKLTAAVTNPLAMATPTRGGGGAGLTSALLAANGDRVPFGNITNGTGAATAMMSPMAAVKKGALTLGSATRGRAAAVTAVAASASAIAATPTKATPSKRTTAPLTTAKVGSAQRRGGPNATAVAAAANEDDFTAAFGL